MDKGDEWFVTLIFAHRGFSSIEPENTMSAFQEAEKCGADGIELDVQLTKDGEVVVIHDEKVDRTTNGKGYVKDYTLSELQQLNAHYIFKKQNEKVRIPTLKEVFDWLAGNHLICNVEIKSHEFQQFHLEEKVIAFIRRYGFEKRVILSSFNHYSIVHCYRLAPDVETALLYSYGIYLPWVYAKGLHARAIHPHYQTLTEEIVQMSRQNGIKVRPYTVNREKDMKRLFAMGCDAIITDEPKKALRLRQSDGQSFSS
ncbi:glycerophosphodiester phosphodiesterase [Bacillus sp. FSL W8-0116]|uniref:glycerophosphodiester phosphodiesterase n=1 Tax=Bacillus sp. FSL W8-0116 TaxID=2978206 RepID=UPI0030F4F7A6